MKPVDSLDIYMEPVDSLDNHLEPVDSLDSVVVIYLTPLLCPVSA